MVAHSDIAYVIDQEGRVRAIFDADPDSGTAPTRRCHRRRSPLPTDLLRPTLPDEIDDTAPEL